MALARWQKGHRLTWQGAHGGECGAARSQPPAPRPAQEASAARIGDAVGAWRKFSPDPISCPLVFAVPYVSHRGREVASGCALALGDVGVPPASIVGRQFS